jgi:hypothetical protein
MDQTNALPPQPEGDKRGAASMSSTATAEIPVPLQRHHAEADPHGKRLAVLAFTALGVVYGDIGTSPLYAIQDAFKPVYGLTPEPERVYGLLSLVVWSLVLVVTVKYVGFILRADNKGEGGVYALLALAADVRCGGTRGHAGKLRRRADSALRDHAGVPHPW